MLWIPMFMPILKQHSILWYIPETLHLPQYISKKRMFSEDTMKRCKRGFMTLHMTKYHEFLFVPLCHFPKISFLILSILSLHSSPRLTLHSFSSNTGSTMLLLVNPSKPPPPRAPVCFLFVVSNSPFCSVMKQSASGVPLTKQRGGC